MMRMFRRAVFVEVDRCARIEEAVFADVRRERPLETGGHADKINDCPDGEVEHEIHTLECVASTMRRRSSMISQWVSRTDMSMGGSDQAV
jgi:hypothetical protein